MASIARWGGLQFADNEVNLVNISRTSKYSERNRRLQNIVTMQCFGEILGDLSTQLSRITEIENGLKQDGKDFRYEVNSTLAHSMLNGSDCISGTRIVARSFPRGDAAELSNRRSFSFTVQGIYDAVDDDLVSWQETVETIGDGGPRFYVLESAIGIPVAIYTANNTIVTYRQTGMAVGYSAHPIPPGPVNPAGELRPQRRITRMSGKQMGNGIKFFPVKWSYLMFRDPATFGSQDFLPVSK